MNVNSKILLPVVLLLVILAGADARPRSSRRRLGFMKHEVDDEVDYLQRRLFTARVGNRRLGAYYDDQPEVFDQSDDEEQVGNFMKQVKKVQRHIGHRQKRWNKGFLFDQSEEPTCCVCFNGGDGSGGCLTVQQCNAKPTYYCNQVGPESGCQLAGDTCS